MAVLQKLYDNCNFQLLTTLINAYQIVVGWLFFLVHVTLYSLVSVLFIFAADSVAFYPCWLHMLEIYICMLNSFVIV